MTIKITKLKALINDIPLPIRLFLGKALLFFVVWKIIYGVFLYDSKVLDHPLTIHVGEATVKLLNIATPMSGFTSKREIKTSTYFGKVSQEEASLIYHKGKEVIYIVDRCNGLELIVLYIGFIVCMPSKFWRKVLYVIIGVIILDITNILRCSGLIFLHENYHGYFEFAHHYLAKASIYTATFIIWMVYSRNINFKNEAIQIR
ncbi:exosortase/archaeosortase family protein [Algibacter luteus]|uniref:exosortase/archaeosortase family protein n=1 Tax=Algibacter luteus TaxID=1178825 RepID=UPI002594A19C|nr:exosortase/archaeosortase family protein [Algibacter luteus]WJJ96097.1 exosortase/archaeosortase family protein [Algibacter luteus]